MQRRTIEAGKRRESAGFVIGCFQRVVKEDFLEEVTLEWRPESSQGESQERKSQVDCEC